MQDDWIVAHARRIYRMLGNREKYLELRYRRMNYGADFHDLATFYWEAGEKKKALQVAETGLQKGQGRMDELRQFASDRAEESGDREKYLAIQYAQAMDGLTLKKYKSLKKICTKAEWPHFESKVLAGVKSAWQTGQLKIW
jgi:hypothetical protein